MHKPTSIEQKPLYHKAGQVALDGSGRMSALCFKRPRMIGKPAQWTFCDAAVTCPRCLKILGIKEKRTATVTKYDGFDLTVIADPTGAFEEYFKTQTPRSPVGAVVPAYYTPESFLITIRPENGPLERPAAIYMDRIPTPDQFTDFRQAMEEHFLPRVRQIYTTIF